MRMTAQRKTILDAVRALGAHPTADEVYRHVRRRMPRVSLATVYRNLERLTLAGAIQCVETGRGPMRFEPRIEPHCHVRCTVCGCVRDGPEGLVPPIRSWKGFQILGACVQLVGVCPSCRGGARRTGRRGKE